MTEDKANDDKVRKDNVILIAYSIYNKDGKLLEARTPENPVEFLVGHGQMLKALEKNLLGQTEGFKGDFYFNADEAHGKYKKDLVVTMPRSQFPEDIEIKKGMKFESVGPDGKPLALHVLDIEGQNVLVDGNHPLAGEDLRFDVSLLKVREASLEEIKRGQTLSAMTSDNETVH